MAIISCTSLRPFFYPFISAWLPAGISCLERPLFLFIEEHLEIPASTALEEFRRHLTLALLLSFLSDALISFTTDVYRLKHEVVGGLHSVGSANCAIWDRLIIAAVPLLGSFSILVSAGFLSIPPCFAIAGLYVGNGLWVVGCFNTLYCAGSNVAMLDGNEFASLFVLLVHVASSSIDSTYRESGSAPLGIIGWILDIREFLLLCKLIFTTAVITTTSVTLVYQCSICLCCPFPSCMSPSFIHILHMSIHRSE